ncbi:MAG: GNAT family N-acetyltransferase [Candidatus Obscuribacterales bacterium]
MIKISPLLASDYAQTCALLGMQECSSIDNALITNTDVMKGGLAFWQHWLPCQYHLSQSIYVAREDGVVLGFIVLSAASKSKQCWKVENLVVHPEHRGRGLAQELLRYVFAQFGSQGVAHFIAEVSCSNDAALSLFAHCGFCRSARVTYYQIDRKDAQVQEVESEFRLASYASKNGLFQLHQEVLPPDLRLVFERVPDDYRVGEKLAFTSVERKRNKFMRKRVWYWVSQDPERRVLSSAVKVMAEPDVGYRLEFAVHPGWKHLAADLVNFAVMQLQKPEYPDLPIWAKVCDFEPEVDEAVQAVGFERTGEFFLLSREHWTRAKHPRVRRVEGVLPNIANPAINFPLATERVKWHPNPEDYN